MKFYTTILTLLILFGSLNSKAQETEDYRLIVGVAKFNASNVKQERFVNIISERVLDVLNQQKRFQVIDLDGTARKEVISKAQENYKSKNWIEANKTISAEYTLTGTLSNIKFIRLNGGKGYKSSITYTIKIIHTESGEIIPNGTATFSSIKSAIRLTPESALQSATETTLQDLSNYFSNSFPIKLNLVRIEQSKKDKATVVLLDGGSKIGIVKNTKFEVFYIDNSLGKPLPRYLGKVKISKILSEDFSEAKITKGGEVIFSAFNSNKKIICKTKTQ